MLLKRQGNVEPLIDLPPAGIHTDEELGETQNAVAQICAARMRLRAAEYIQSGER